MRKQNNVSIDKKTRSSFEDFHMASVFWRYTIQLCRREHISLRSGFGLTVNIRRYRMNISQHGSNLCRYMRLSVFLFLAFQVVSKRLEVCKLFRTRESDSRIVDTWYISYSSHNPFVRTYAHCLLCRRNCNSIHAFIGSALCISLHSLGAKQNVVETNRQYGKPSYADRRGFGRANDPA